jgi:hypothetical protein
MSRAGGERHERAGNGPDRPVEAPGSPVAIPARAGQPPRPDRIILPFLAVDTRAPYTRDYDGAQGNKPAHYMLRWVNSRGEVGPWSATVTATIGA